MESHYCFVDDDRKAIPCLRVRGQDHTEDEFDVPVEEGADRDVMAMQDFEAREKSEAVEFGLPEKAKVVGRAVREFHQRYPVDMALPARHSNGAYTDSLAMTHCICWGGAWRMLDYLIDNPDEFERLRALG